MKRAIFRESRNVLSKTIQNIMCGLLLLSSCNADVTSKMPAASPRSSVGDTADTPGTQSDVDQGYQEILVTGGSESGYVDGGLEQARFADLSDIVFDKDNNFYVADTGNNVIRYVDLQKKRVSTFAGQAYVLSENMSPAETYRDGEALQSLFREPLGLALTSDGSLYVADSANHKVRKVYQNQVSTILGNSPENSPPGKKRERETILRESGSLNQATTFLPRLLRPYQDKYLFLYEGFSTSRFIDLENQTILGAHDMFGKGLPEGISPQFEYAQFGGVADIVFDDKGGAWVDSLTYAIRYISVGGENRFLVGDNKTTLRDGFTGYEWSVAQKDGDFECFSFFSPREVLQGSNKNYLFVRDLKPDFREKKEASSTLRLVNLNKRFVSTVPGIEDFERFFISPDDELYIVKKKGLYRIEPSPVKLLPSGESVS